MKISGSFGILLVLLAASCSGFGSLSSAKQELELVENGYLAMSGGDYVTAEHLLSQALTINDKNPYARLNLGVIYQETQRFDKARQFYQSVIDLDPDETAAATNVNGHAGKKLGEIARINLDNLPPLSATSSQSIGRKDTDGDGVPDDMDKCVDTPAQAVVGANGCWNLLDIFPSGKADIQPDAYKQLDEVAKILLNNAMLRIEIQGHTDNSGSASSNKRLSDKRAQSVAQYLIKQGVGPDRLQWVGYGQTRPIASNNTADGRKQNRRVELKPIPR
jgi:outer membrane protein OmpA-like peptidoglycan-associated protein